MSLCSVGKAFENADDGDGGDACSEKDVFILRSSLSDIDAELLRRRCSLNRVDSVCQKHYNRFVKFYAMRNATCCDPFENHKKSVKTSLQEITLELADHCNVVVKLIPGQKICKVCRVTCQTKAAAYDASVEASPELPASGSSVSLPTQNRKCSEKAGLLDSQGTSSTEELLLSTPSSQDTLFPTPPEVAASDLNKCLNILGQSPIDSRKLHTLKGYGADKLNRIHEAVVAKAAKILGGNSDDMHFSSHGKYLSSDFEELLTQLKIKYSEANDKKTKLQILSVLPSSWSASRIQEEFDASDFMVRNVKALVAEQGVLPKIAPKAGVALDDNIVKKVIAFYEDNSRIMPGKKDFLSVKIGNERIHKQKRLVLQNLSELHLLFQESMKTTDPEFKISFSKFAQLRPKECVLAGASGTHSVCVCIHHENFALMLEKAPLYEESCDGKKKFLTLNEVLCQTMCDEAKDDCYFGDCSDCPGTSVIKEMLEVNFDIASEDNVCYYQWVTVDRCNLELLQKSTEDFIDVFISSIPAVRKHHFIAEAQAKYLRDLKNNLKEGECIVTGDFSENYSPIYQDAIQGVHWENTQITIHPFVCYAKSGSSLNILNFVVISDSVTHDNTAVFTFQHKLIAFLKSKIPGLKKNNLFQ